MSNRSMWTGLVRLGMLNVPVSIAKAYSQEKENSLKDLCATHKTPVSRSERCSSDSDCALSSKVKGIEITEGEWREFSADEHTRIQDATKSDTLDVLDAQPLDEFPLEFSLGTYFVRSDKKSKGSEQAFGLLCATLEQTGLGLFVKWCSATRQRMCVISADRGIVYLREIPTAFEIREPGDDETRHDGVQVDPAAVKMLSQLFEQTQAEGGFNHTDYVNKGLSLRQEAVDRVLNGDEGEEITPTPEQEPAIDIMAQISASIEAGK